MCLTLRTERDLYAAKMDAQDTYRTGTFAIQMWDKLTHLRTTERRL
jgi:hypothetical protein